MTSESKGDYNWFRTYFAHLPNGELVFEALHNNEDWKEGDNALKSINWKKSNTFYSVRNFIVARKSSEPQHPLDQELLRNLGK